MVLVGFDRCEIVGWRDRGDRDGCGRFDGFVGVGDARDVLHERRGSARLHEPAELIFDPSIDGVEVGPFRGDGFDVCIGFVGDVVHEGDGGVGLDELDELTIDPRIDGACRSGE